MNKTVKVSLAFRKLPDAAYGDFAATVHTNLYSHSVFSAAPVTEADLQAAITAFRTAKTAQATGGKEATAAKNQRREELQVKLKDLAYYVQIACANDLEVLLSSGFDATKSNRVPSVVTKAVVERITQIHTGVALVTAKAERGARSYEAQAAEILDDGTLGPYGPPVQQSSSRKIPVANLTPGKMYVFRARVYGTKGDISDWSDAVSQRVM